MPSVIRVARWMAAVVLFFVGVEFWARVDDYLTYGAPLLGVYNNDGLYMRDSLGRIGKPYASYRKWRLNEYGMRGPAVLPGRTTILCLGASETFGLYESDGQEYPRQLERRLNALAGHDEYQVVNAAYPGESAYTANVRAAQLVAAVHPRVALVYPTPADYIWLPYLDASMKPQAGPAPTPRFELRVGDRIRTLLKSTVPWAIQTRLRAREIEKSAAEFTVMDTLPDENVKRFRTDVSQLITTLRSLGVVPVVVTHASAFGSQQAQADRSMLIAWRKFYPMLKEDGFIHMENRMNAALRELAAEQHVPLIDAAAQLPPAAHLFADFVHFTNEGADAMSRTLATGLLPVLRSDER